MQVLALLAFGWRGTAIAALWRMQFLKVLGSTAFAIGLAAAPLYAQAQLQPPQPVPDTVLGDQTANNCGLQAPPPGSTGEYEQQMTAHHAADHHYDSAAVEANDALIITEVKSAVADADLSQPYALTVDADHGTVILTGQVANSDMAKQIYQLASQCDGVKAVQSHIDWPSKRD